MTKSKLKQKRQEAYDTLIAQNAHWGRNSDNSIYIWVSGYFTQEFNDISNYMLKQGFKFKDMEFDRMCGKTVLRLKHD